MFAKNLKSLKARRGFTLIEIMIVVLIIGILLAIAVPNFVKARESSRQKACVSNLKQLQSACEQYAMDNKLSGTATIAIGDITGSSKYITVAPTCPAGGAYTVSSADVDPTCGYTSADYPHTLANFH